MIYLTLLSLVSGGAIATKCWARPGSNTARYELLSGGLLAVGLVLLGVGLQNSLC